MRTLLATIIFSLLGLLSLSQKNFQGSIRYDCQIIGLNKTAMEIHFGNHKIKKTEPGVPFSLPQAHYWILDCTNGNTYAVNDSNHTYALIQEILLRGSGEQVLSIDTTHNKKILGYNCTAYQLPATHDSLRYYGIQVPTMWYWYADSLLYTIDEQYGKINGINRITNGKNICLGMELIIRQEHDSDIHAVINATAVTPAAIPDSFFTIPPGYTAIEEEQFREFDFLREAGVELQMSEVRVVNDEPPPPPPPPPPPSTTKKKKKSIKKQSHQ